MPHGTGLGAGGALSSNDGRLHISGKAYFINNSARLVGGGLFAINTSVNLSGSIYRNIAQGRGGISLVNNSRSVWLGVALYCQLGIQHSL